MSTHCTKCGTFVPMSNYFSTNLYHCDNPRCDYARMSASVKTPPVVVQRGLQHYLSTRWGSSHARDEFTPTVGRTLAVSPAPRIDEADVFSYAVVIIAGVNWESRGLGPSGYEIASITAVNNDALLMEHYDFDLVLAKWRFIRLVSRALVVTP